MLQARSARDMFLVILLAGACWSGVGGRALAEDDPWADIRQSVFKDRVIVDGSPNVQIFAPNQADNAALVPISVRIPANVTAKTKSLTLVIDRNPMPVAATFAFGEGFRSAPDVGERMLGTRVRVDAFSRVRAILELTDGTLYMASKFVIGSGGCSAPVSSDADAALANLGKTKLTVNGDEAHSSQWREARLMIKHPNFTGMQMDKKSGDYTPARYVDSIEVKQGNSLLMRMEGGISLSEDPNIRFTFGTSSSDDLEFRASDTAGAKFSATSRPNPS